ncbi:hypothetical protein Tco_0917755 [Tanacetum coccineum]
MSDMTVCLNDFSYIPPNNKLNKPTQGDIGETSNESTQAQCNEFEKLYASANEELYSGCDFMTRLDFMAKFTHLKVKVGYEHVVMDMTHRDECCHHREYLQGFAVVLVVLNTGASQTRQHDTLVRLPMDIRLKIDLGKSVGDLTSHLPQSSFDVGSGRISIVIVNTLVSL